MVTDASARGDTIGAHSTSPGIDKLASYQCARFAQPKAYWICVGAPSAIVARSGLACGGFSIGSLWLTGHAAPPVRRAHLGGVHRDVPMYLLIAHRPPNRDSSCAVSWLISGLEACPIYPRFSHDGGAEQIPHPAYVSRISTFVV